MNWRILVVCGLVGPQFVLAQGKAEVAVQVDRQFFNPSIGQKVKITLSENPSETLRVEIVDRDGFTIRSLEVDSPEKMANLEWDGRDRSGASGPDEAYSLRIRRSSTGEVVYDPSAHAGAGSKEIAGAAYSRQSGTLSYQLEQPSRVHVQVGQAFSIEKNAPPDGPILHTVVDEEPRVGGRVIENWNGWDEAKRVYIPDLQHFAVGIVATPLPETSFITVGNRKEDFLTYARRVRGDAMQPRDLASGSHERHRALRSFEDRSPALELHPASGADGPAWVADKTEDLKIVAAMDDFAAKFFLSGKNELVVYLGLTRVQLQSCDANPCTIRIPASRLVAGSSLLAVNWASGFGPVAVATRRLEVR